MFFCSTRKPKIPPAPCENQDRYPSLFIYPLHCFSLTKLSTTMVDLEKINMFGDRLKVDCYSLFTNVSSTTFKKTSLYISVKLIENLGSFFHVSISR